jgi:hypothetical protein
MIAAVLVLAGAGAVAGAVAGEPSGDARQTQQQVSEPSTASSFHVIWFISALGKMRARPFESADACERFARTLSTSTPWQILEDGAERSRSRSRETLPLWPADWPTTWPAATLEHTAAEILESRCRSLSSIQVNAGR